MKTIADLPFHVPPVCAGQMIEVAYAGAGEMGIVRRVHDRSANATRYEVADWLDDETFEPWNGEPADRDDWREISAGAEVE